MTYVPLPPLDRALRDLEETHTDAAPKIQSLREAIALGRSEGWLNAQHEERIEHELNNIRSRVQFDADAIVRLTAKILKEAP